MKDYEQMENDIVALLNSNQELKASAIITSLPDNESEGKPNFTKSRVYIACTGALYGLPENLEVIVQEETISFEAIITSRTRKGNSGVLGLTKMIGSILQGFKLYQGCDRISLNKHGYIEDGPVPNNFNYVLGFTILTKAVANQSDPDEVDPDNDAYPLKLPEFLI